MLSKIKEFQKLAQELDRNPNSVEELRLWLEAQTKTAQDLSFTSDVDDVDIRPRPKDVDFVNAKAKVFWDLQMDAREYGIKDIYPTVRKVVISGTYEYAVDIDEEAREEEFELSITAEEWNIKEDLMGAKFANGLYPSTVNVDQESKQCTVEF
jgi:hypothetical protein